VKPTSQKNPNNDPGEQHREKESFAEAYRKAAPYLNIGYTWAASVIIFTLIGWYLDKHWNTKPWLTLTGAIIGIVVGFYNFFKTISEEEKRQH